MKYELLNQSEPIQVLKGYSSTNKGFKLLRTSILTDGVRDFCVDYPAQPVIGYSDGNYQNYCIDTLEKSDLYLKDASYVVKALIVKEWACVNGCNKFVDSVKNIDVYLRDTKDKVAMNAAKNDIKSLYASIKEASRSNINVKKKRNS